MLTVNQLIERSANRQVRKRIRMSLQPGTINAVIAAEVGSVIAEALSAQLIVERDEALGRDEIGRASCRERV